MGSFHATCPLSHLPIQAGDPCVLIWFAIDVPRFGIYNLRQALYTHKQTIADAPERKKAIAQATGMTESEIEAFFEPLPVVKAVMVGVYDDYGWIKDAPVKSPESQPDGQYFLYHLPIVEYLLGVPFPTTFDAHELVLDLFNAADLLHLNPVSGSFLIGPSVDIADRMVDMLRFQARKTQMLATLLQREMEKLAEL